MCDLFIKQSNAKCFKKAKNVDEKAQKTHVLNTELGGDILALKFNLNLKLKSLA